MDANCLVVLGATAMGKTKRANALAQAHNGEIISADSRQVYRGLDIGTGKDLSDYTVPYHLIDIIDLTSEYNVFTFLRDCYAAFKDISTKGKLPIITGGTGLYLNAFIQGYVFGGGELLDRPEIRPHILGLRCDRGVLRNRIARRLDERLDAGMLDEVASLHEGGTSWERLDRLGLEYRFCARYLQGLIPDRQTFHDTLFYAICQFSKRQGTWFRGMERQGVCIHWEEGGGCEKNSGEVHLRI
jgi:tRNA dimethylallyltransferase